MNIRSAGVDWHSPCVGGRIQRYAEDHEWLCRFGEQRPGLEFQRKLRGDVSKQETKERLMRDQMDKKEGGVRGRTLTFISSL